MEQAALESPEAQLTAPKDRPSLKQVATRLGLGWCPVGSWYFMGFIRLQMCISSSIMICLSFYLAIYLPIYLSIDIQICVFDTMCTGHIHGPVEFIRTPNDGISIPITFPYFWGSLWE